MGRLGLSARARLNASTAPAASPPRASTRETPRQVRQLSGSRRAASRPSRSGSRRARNTWYRARVARLRRRHRKAAFFGLSPSERCVIVMNRAHRDDRAMHHDDVEGLADLIRLVDETGAEPVVGRFDRLFAPAG